MIIRAQFCHFLTTYSPLLVHTQKKMFDICVSLLKFSRSQNKIVKLKLLPKNRPTNLFFYLDDSEILET